MDFIPGAYVKFFESCGVRVAPLDWRLSVNDTWAFMNELNGVAIVGSAQISVPLLTADGTGFSPYANALFTILDYAKL